jgi:hypothetical protein
MRTTASSRHGTAATRAAWHHGAVGLYGIYARIDTFEVEWLRNDHDEAFRRLKPHADGTTYELDKAWHALFFLLDQAGAPMAAIAGEEPLWEPKDDDEYAPTVLPPHDVATAATFLATMTPERLGTYFDPTALAAAQIYPSIWDRSDDGAGQWVLSHYTGLPEYFARTARYGGAMLLWVG